MTFIPAIVNMSVTLTLQFDFDDIHITDGIDDNGVDAIDDIKSSDEIDDTDDIKSFRWH